MAEKNFKLVRGGRDESELGPVKKYDDMQAGNYVARCEYAAFVTKFGGTSCELTFRIIEGKFFGRRIRGWIPVAINKQQAIVPGIYVDVCTLALGRSINLGWDNLEPKTVFQGKTFVVDCRYRAAKNKECEDETVCKDLDDFFRVGRIVSRVRAVKREPHRHQAVSAELHA